MDGKFKYKIVQPNHYLSKTKISRSITRIFSRMPTVNTVTGLDFLRAGLLSNTTSEKPVRFSKLSGS